MLKNPVGILAYLLLRNDLSWSLLSDHEKRIILEANRDHNVTRDDYSDPEKYGLGRRREGENWDTFRLSEGDHRGRALLEVLEQNRPERVLEVGPGAGYYTRMICEYPSVTNYAAVDIGQAFLDYLAPRLEGLRRGKEIHYRLVCGEMSETRLNEAYHMMVLFSNVHHIPNRLELFQHLTGMLMENGVIFCFDPSHYLIRVLHLMVKSVRNGYLKKDFYLNPNNLSTHHMCSYGEYKSIVSRIPRLAIEKVLFVLPKRLERYRRMFIPARFFSTEIGIILRKRRQHID